MSGHALDKRTVTIIAGVSQSGKSTFALRYAINGPAKYVFMFDPGTGSESYAERLGIEAATDAYELGLSLCRGWVLFNPHEIFPGRLADGFNFFCDWPFAKCQQLPGRKLSIIDEGWRYVAQRRYPSGLANCVQSGGHQGLECMFNTQTPHALHEAIQNECSEAVCFSLNGEKSLAWCAGRGFDSQEISRLQPLEFVSRNVASGGELRGRIKI